MASPDYNDLLIKDNFVDWMNIIANNDTNPLIREAAKEVGYTVNGNNNIAPKPYYEALYTKSTTPRVIIPLPPYDIDLFKKLINMSYKHEEILHSLHPLC